MPKQKKVYIIAEAGVNHNGDASIARRMIAAAARAGADAVKFQTFRAALVAGERAPKAAYQKRRTGTGGSQRAMLEALELDTGAWTALGETCRKKRIDFLSSPFDEESIALLARLGMRTFKIPSGEITNYPCLVTIGRLRKKVILSTGMATLAEVERALAVLAKAGTARKDIVVLHCTSEYPAPYGDVNLAAMRTIGERCRVAVGYSDHTQGTEIAVAAAALGARVIEKHFTLDRTMKGPDHAASLEPDELAVMVRAIRNVEKAMGDGIKRPTRSEQGNAVVSRKSIVAARVIAKGAVIRTGDITARRPGNGMSPMRWERVVGKRAKKGFVEGEQVNV